MNFSYNEDQESMRQELQQFLDEEKRRAKTQGMSTSEFGPHLWGEMAQRGWLGIFAPREYGGLGRSPLDFGIFLEALHSFGAPEIVRTWFDINSYIMATLLIHGSHDIKQSFVLPMCEGKIRSSIAWTEPDGGSDGGMHTSRAEDKGSHFLVNGTKIYNESHRCNYTCLVVKTNSSVPRGQGHSMFMVDLSSPGITMNPLWTMWGLRRDEVVFEDVKVPKASLIGKEGEGWDYWYNTAQTYEWSILGNTGLLRRDFEAFVKEIRGMDYRGKSIVKLPTTRYVLAEIALELEIGRLLYYRAWESSRGLLPDLVSAAMTKVYTTECLWQRMYARLLDIIGEYGELMPSPATRKWSIARLGLPVSYEFGPALAVGGMPTEIQRNVIASIGLGLPSYL